jgi:hypothetical protein
MRGYKLTVIDISMITRVEDHELLADFFSGFLTPVVSS